jgi:SecD/SecF fusion protein
LDKIKAQWPAYAQRIDQLVAKYDEWSSKKGALEDPSDLKRRIRGAGVLEFRIVADRDTGNPGMIASTGSGRSEPIARYVEQLQTRGPRPRPGDKYIWLPIKDPKEFLGLRHESTRTLENFEQYKDSYPQIVEKYAGKYYVLSHGDREHGLLRPSESGVRWKLNGAFASRDASSGKPIVIFSLDPRGGSVFGKLTSENIGRQLMIVLDGEAMSHATIQSKITERGEIRGDFSREDVADLVNTLEAGSLPARLKETPLAEKEIGPSLGETNRKSALLASVVGVSLVVLFMAVYYRLAGLVANVALILNLLFVLALMAATEATFTVPGIAGLALSLGMAVDANVLIFERFREERERGHPLRKALKLGYEKAFSTIIDSNLTTLITCAILGYLGSEEIKGFAMTLGFGLIISMFTALFVTRTIFNELIRHNLIKDLKMMRFFHKPNINWLAKARFFVPASVAAIVVGLAFFTGVTIRNKEDLYDIEFLGGTSVLVELQPGVKMGDEDIRKAISSTGSSTQPTARDFLTRAADALANARVSPGAVLQQYRVEANGLTGTQTAVLVRASAEDKLVRGGVTVSGNTATFDLKSEAQLDLEGFKALLHSSADYARRAAQLLASARVQTVSETGEVSQKGNAFEVVTVETNKELVQAAVVAALGDKLLIDRPIDFQLASDPQRAPEGLFPIQEDDRYLGDAIGREANFDVRAFKGGVALVFDQLNPPQPIARIDSRLKSVRLQPEFQGSEWREYALYGLTPAGKSGDGAELYSSIAMVTADEKLPYYDDPAAWEAQFARPELAQARMAFAQEQSLRKVVQFDRQVGDQAQTQAYVALVLSLIAISAYVWIRFGTIEWGLAAILALVHDVAMTLGVVTLSHWVYNNPIGRALGLEDFKVDLAMVAAILTIIGYSINDTIVVFDRVRENRGKLGQLTPTLINGSVNQTLSRTILTSLTAFLTMLAIYIFGGSGARGFAFAMLFGIFVGTYSSIAIALPALYRPRVLNVIVACLVGVGLLAGAAMAGARGVGLAVLGVLILAALGGAIYVLLRGRPGFVRERGTPTPAAA